ncbi:MAG: amidohydrolase family protein [Erysipelotrichaceae bacterium]
MTKILIKNGIILDGTKDMQPQQKDVLINDGIIEKIQANLSAASDFEVIDLNGKYLLPGLINLHCHLPSSGKPISFSKNKVDLPTLLKIVLKFKIGKAALKKMCYKQAKIELLSGVTTLRAVGGISNIDSSIRDDINSQKCIGPTLLVSDYAIATINGHMVGTVAYPCESIEAAVNCVDEIVKQGKVDWIKIMITGGVLDGDVPGKPAEMKMEPEMIKAICDRAHSYNLPVSAHVESTQGVKAALENGVDTIEHGAELDDYLIDLFQKTNRKLICTISPAIPMKLLDDSQLPDPFYKINGTIVCDGIISAAKSALANSIEVGLGNDVGCPFITHYDFYRELVYFDKYVCHDKRFALYTATLQNAKILQLADQIGSIEEGKQADLIVTAQNPLDDLTNLKNVELVIKKGQVIKGKFKRNEKCEAILNSIG